MLGSQTLLRRGRKEGDATKPLEPPKEDRAQWAHRGQFCRNARCQASEVEKAAVLDPREVARALPSAKHAFFVAPQPATR